MSRIRIELSPKTIFVTLSNGVKLQSQEFNKFKYLFKVDQMFKIDKLIRLNEATCCTTHWPLFGLTINETQSLT